MNLEEGAHWVPARLPDRTEPLRGRLVDLLPLDADAHRDSLFDASHSPADPDLWRYLFYGPFATIEEFGEYLRQRANSQDVFYTIVDRQSAKPSGLASYLRMKPEHGVIEIGHIWFGASLQRTRAATEAIYLLARHVFDDLGYRRLEWKCDAANQRSRRAATRFGFAFDGIFRQHMVIKGKNRDTAWYAMLDRDWPVAGEAFARWLSRENFDAEGHQLRGLADIRSELTRQHTRHEPLGSGGVVIRPANEADEASWRQLWQAYNDFYEASVPPSVTSATWQRIMSPDSPIGCIVAEAGGEVAGFANFVSGPYTWSDRPHCLLEDLYVRPEFRSFGIGRQLIEALVKRAKSAGWTEVYWITKEDNFRARRLYESLTPPDGFIQYTIEVA